MNVTLPGMATLAESRGMHSKSEQENGNVIFG